MKYTPLVLSALLGLSVVGCSSISMNSSPVSLAPPPSSLLEGSAVPVVAHSDHEFLLQSADPKLAANKRLVYDLWRTVLNAGHVEAADDYLTPDYMQHNPIASTGREAFKAYFSTRERLDEVPEQIQDPLITIVAEGNYVAMAFVSEYDEVDGSGTYTSTHFDVVRIEGGLIAEHWDSVQIPKGVFPAAPEDGGPLPVRGIEGLAQLAMLRSEEPALANNKRLVFDTWRHIPEAGREELAELYLDPIYIQHNPNAVTGRAGFQEYFSKRPDSPIESYLEDPLVTMLAEGDLVVQVLQEERPNPNKPDELYYISWIDMFRISDGRLIEHWDTASKGELPASMQNAE